MATKNKAYIDTSAFIAFLDEGDTHHPLFSQLFADPPGLITTPLVIAEGHGWFLKRYDQSRALRFLSFIEELKPLEIVPAGKEALLVGAELIRKFSDQDLTLADAVGLWVMKKTQVRLCWSTDRHLGLTGVPLVIY